MIKKIAKLYLMVQPFTSRQAKQCGREMDMWIHRAQFARNWYTAPSSEQDGTKAIPLLSSTEMGCTVRGHSLFETFRRLVLLLRGETITAAYKPLLKLVI